jgi:hypothetical protein
MENVDAGPKNHAKSAWSTSAMAAKQHVFGLIDAGREIRRPPMVGMQFLDEGPVRATDLLSGRPRLNAKDLIGFLFSDFASARRSRAGAGITLRMLTPVGLSAVEISCQ